MRSIGELLAEMGFNKEASPDAQKAFFKHLVKAAEEGQKATPQQASPAPQVAAKKSEPQQLEFNFGDPPPKKVS